MQIHSAMIAEYHQPVLLEEVLEYLNPIPGGVYVDCTLGAGGHAAAILEQSSPGGTLLGLDIDPRAVEIAEKRLETYRGRFITRICNFSHLPEILDELGLVVIDGILLDLGVSSMQIDDPARGFSFRVQGPLDMRMNPETGTSAADIINNLPFDGLREVLSDYGEERYARQIAREIMKNRPISTTGQLSEIVYRIYQQNQDSKKEFRIHPATRTFQAFRIAVNQELKSLSSVLTSSVSALKWGGRLVVISFHSLEDRIVKRFFRRESSHCICPADQPVCTCSHQPQIRVLTRKPVLPVEQEISKNKRSRSAKLRAAEKLPALA
jgi:16S rRNA (cytosine1402-N4)-methyltransferase